MDPVPPGWIRQPACARPRVRPTPNEGPRGARGRRGPRRWQDTDAHKSLEAVLAEARPDETPPARLLHGRRARAPASHPGPGDGHEALSERRGGRVLLHEAHAFAPSGLAPHLPDRAQLGKRHRLPGDRRSRGPALGDQSRLHRPQSLVLALRRHGPPGLPPLRPGSRSRGRFRACPRDRARREGGPGRFEDAGLRQEHRLPRHPRLRADPPRPDAEGGLDLREGVRAADGSRPGRKRSPPSTGKTGGPRAGSSWTTTRTPGAARSPRCTRSGQRRRRRSPRR